MPRVTSQRTRQAILVVGEHTDPFILPEKLELFDSLGQPIDLANDRSRVRWAGIWRSDLIYDVNDMVYHEGFLWIAPDEIDVGIEPGVGFSDPDVSVSRGVMFKQSDRLISTEDILYTIGPPPGQRRDNDISAGYGAVILLDRTGVIAAGTKLVITPVARAGTGGMTLGVYDSANNLQGVINWSQAEVDSHTPKEYDIGGMTVDYFCHVFFNGGTDGSFSAHVTSATNLAAPPASGAEWDVMVAQVPPGGTAGQRLVKNSSTDFDVDWTTPSDVLPPGGGLGDFLVKDSAADGDVAWVPASSVISPDELPPGGADGYILAKASAADGDVEWIPAPSGSVQELPAGGSTNQVLAKSSNADYAVAWVAATPRDVPVGGTTDQVLAKNSNTDRDLKWATVAAGSSVPDYIYLDEKIATDVSALYTKESGSGALGYGTVTDGDGDVRGYLYNNALSSDAYFIRNDGHNASFRDVLVAIEVEWHDNVTGTPVFSFDLRQQSDRWIRIQVHGTNVHIYTTAPGAADTLRANLTISYTIGHRAWIVGMVYHNTVTGWYGANHPLSRALGGSTSGSNVVSFDLGSDGNFNTEARRTGRADRMRMATGAGGTANKHRILRHLIIDIDKLPIL